MTLFEYVHNYIKENNIELKTGELTTIFDCQFLQQNFNEISSLDDFKNKILKITNVDVFFYDDQVISTNPHNYSEKMFNRVDCNIIFLFTVYLMKDYLKNYRVVTNDRCHSDNEYYMNRDRFDKLDKILNEEIIEL